MTNLIKPHGSDTLNPLYVMDDAERASLVKEAAGLPSVVVCSAAAANAVMMGGGYFNPLTGYMNVADAMSVAENMKTTRGLFFPVPILNMLHDASAIKGADKIALRDPNVAGNPVIAIQQVEAIEEFSDEQMKTMTMKVFRTDDPEHPGVKAFNSVGKVAVSGPIKVLNFSYFETDFPDTRLEKSRCLSDT
jgi:sulfate adenylyltransferase